MTTPQVMNSSNYSSIFCLIAVPNFSEGGTNDTDEVTVRIAVINRKNLHRCHHKNLKKTRSENCRRARSPNNSVTEELVTVDGVQNILAVLEFGAKDI